MDVNFFGHLHIDYLIPSVVSICDMQNIRTNLQLNFS